MKYKLIYLAFIVSLQINAAVTFKATYSETADLFQFLDCASNWWDGYCGDEGQYRLEFEKKAKLTDEDLKLFKKYEELRFKYYVDEDQKEKDPTKNRNGFFATTGSLTADFMALSFYKENSVEKAIEALTKLSTEDKDFLKKFYEHFQDRVKPFLKESIAFKKAAKELSGKLQKKSYKDFFKMVQDFYGVEGNFDYTALFVWWPPLERDYAYPVSDYLVLSKNPVKHLSWSDEEIVFHEVVHTISKRLPLEKKQQLTKVFLEECPTGTSLKKGTILEEPLAVAVGQMLFLKKFNPKKYKSETNWYRNEWINKFSQAIFPEIETTFAKKGKLDEELVRKLGKICKRENR